MGDVDAIENFRAHMFSSQALGIGLLSSPTLRRRINAKTVEPFDVGPSRKEQAALPGQALRWWPARAWAATARWRPTSARKAFAERRGPENAHGRRPVRRRAETVVRTRHP